jgi:hypothetical protein
MIIKPEKVKAKLYIFRCISSSILSRIHCQINWRYFVMYNLWIKHAALRAQTKKSSLAVHRRSNDGLILLRQRFISAAELQTSEACQTESQWSERCYQELSIYKDLNVSPTTVHVLLLVTWQSSSVSVFCTVDSIFALFPDVVCRPSFVLDRPWRRLCRCMPVFHATFCCGRIIAVAFWAKLYQPKIISSLT